MELRTGTVSHVRRLAEAHGNHQAVWTQHLYTFRVGNQPVELAMPSPPQVEDGDEVAVAGDVVNGTLVARAYRNLTSGAYGRWQHSYVKAAALTVAPLAIGGPIAVLTAGEASGVLGVMRFAPLAVGLVYCLPMAFAEAWAASRTGQAATLVSR